MPRALCLYLDDSGTRHPDRDPHPADKPDWFAFGGILIDEADEAAAHAAIAGFRANWPECTGTPLHSIDIRSCTGKFAWLATIGVDRRDAFYAGIAHLLEGLPILAIAGVIDRPGYNARYSALYGKDRWNLCKTAFTIVVERAAKHALDLHAKLRVYVEQSDPKSDKALQGYYEALRRDGHPFDASRAAQYLPLTAKQYTDVLFEFRLKTKKSRLMQIADLVLYPQCRAGYSKEYRPYQHLLATRKLIDCHYAGREGERGTKYSCFELCELKKQNPATRTGFSSATCVE